MYVGVLAKVYQRRWSTHYNGPRRLPENFFMGTDEPRILLIGSQGISRVRRLRWLGSLDRHHRELLKLWPAR